MAIDGKSVAFLVAKEGIEQVELTEPWKAVEHAGGTPRLISVEPGEVQGFNHLTAADRFAVDETADRARAGDYSALALDEELVVCTGGQFPLISSRKPDDLPAFCKELIQQLEKV
jgi:putative intracellular protease/amidase